MPIKDWRKDYAEELGMNDFKDTSIDHSKTPTFENDIEEFSFNPEQIKELCKQDLNLFAGLTIPGMFEFLFPKVLLGIWDLLLQKVYLTRDFSQIALGIPRGHGKTTLIKLFIVYCVLYTDKKFIQIVATTADLAEKILRDVAAMLDEPNVKATYGDWKRAIETDRNDLKVFGFRNRTIIIAAIGAGGSLRGVNLAHSRPDVMIFEDIQSRECADSEQQSKALETWMIGTAMKAKSPKGCLFIFCGNMYPTEHSILKKLRNNPKWIKFISGAILVDGTALWPELRSIEELIEELDNDIAAGHPEIFFSEVLNDTEAGINTKIDFSLIKPWRWGPEELPQGKFIIIDPSNDKATSDNVAIGYFEVFDETPAMKSLIEERLSPGDAIRKSLILAMQTNTRVIFVEAQAYQYSLLFWFEEISKQHGIEGIQFLPIYSGSISKNFRIAEMLKSLTSNEIAIHNNVRSAVIHQISNWNPLRRNNVDNALDLLTYPKRIVGEYAPLISTEYSPLIIESNSAKVRNDNHAF